MMIKISIDTVDYVPKGFEKSLGGFTQNLAQLFKEKGSNKPLNKNSRRIILCNIEFDENDWLWLKKELTQVGIKSNLDPKNKPTRLTITQSFSVNKFLAYISSYVPDEFIDKMIRSVTKRMMYGQKARFEISKLEKTDKQEAVKQLELLETKPRRYRYHHDPVEKEKQLKMSNATYHKDPVKIMEKQNLRKNLVS